MIKLKDIFDYIFGDQAVKDLNVEGVPPAQRERALIKKQESLSSKLTDKFGDNIDKPSFADFVCTYNEPLARVLYTKKYSAEAQESSSVVAERNVQGAAKALLDNAEIIAKFTKLQEKHKFTFEGIKDEDLAQVYVRLFKVAKFIEDIVEANALANAEQAYMHAYKMLLIWGDNLAEIDRHLSQNYLDHEHPLHDALVFTIPTDGSNIHLLEWRKLINSGPQILKFFGAAAEIEAKLDGRAPLNKEEAATVASKITYPRAEENPELALICKECNLQEAIFNKILEIEKARTIHHDNLPDVHIAGADIKEEYAGYHLVKLPKNDLRGYVLGELTNCCQSVDNAGEEFAIDGMNRQHNGFYVLLKPITKTAKSLPSPFKGKRIDYELFKPVGQCYAWLSIHGNLVLDSWEYLGEEDKQKSIGVLKHFANRIVQEESSLIGRVTIGKGGQTPDELRQDKTKFAEKPVEGSASYDSPTQYVLSCSETLESTSHRLGLKNTCYSLKFLKALEANEALLSQIKLLEENGIDSVIFGYLTSNAALSFYQQFRTTPEWLTILSQENESILDCLLSYCAFYIYKTFHISPEELIQLGDHGVLNCVTSHEALRIYENCPEFGPMELLQVTHNDKAMLGIVASRQAVRLYSLFPGKFTPRELISISQSSEGLCKVILSYEAQGLYIGFKMDPMELVSISSDIEFLKRLIYPSHWDGYGDLWNFYDTFPAIHPRELAKIARFDLEILKCIVDGNLYNNFPGLTPHELVAIADGNVQILQVLRSVNYLCPKFPLQEWLEISGRDPAILKGLMDSNDIYSKFPQITPKALLNISKNNLELLSALRKCWFLYEAFPEITPEILVQLCDGNAELIRALSEPGGTKVKEYKSTVVLCRLINDPLHLLPQDLLEAGERDPTKIRQLKEQICSERAQAFYKAFPGFSDRDLFEFYRTNPDVMHDLEMDKLDMNVSSLSVPEEIQDLLALSRGCKDVITAFKDGGKVFLKNPEFGNVVANWEELMRVSGGNKELILRLFKANQNGFFKIFPHISMEEIVSISGNNLDILRWVTSHRALQIYEKYKISPTEIVSITNRNHLLLEIIDFCCEHLYSMFPEVGPKQLLEISQNVEVIKALDDLYKKYSFCEKRPIAPLELAKLCDYNADKIGLYKKVDEISEVFDEFDLARVLEIFLHKQDLLDALSDKINALSCLLGPRPSFRDFVIRHRDISLIKLIEISEEKSEILRKITSPEAVKFYELSPSISVRILMHIYKIYEGDPSGLHTSQLSQIAKIWESNMEMAIVIIKAHGNGFYHKFEISIEQSIQMVHEDLHVLEVITSQQAMHFYSIFPAIVPTELVNISKGDSKLISAITKLDRFPDINLRELIQLSGYSSEVISAITVPAMKLYEQFPNITLLDLLRMTSSNAELISSITSDGALSFYKKYSQRPEKLIQLSKGIVPEIGGILQVCEALPELIMKKLLSCAALKLYRDYGVSFQSLCTLATSEHGEEAINLLISYKAFKVYERTDVKPSQLLGAPDVESLRTIIEENYQALPKVSFESTSEAYLDSSAFTTLTASSSSLSSSSSSSSAPKGTAASISLPVLGMQHELNAISSVLTSMLSAAKINGVKVTAPAIGVLGAKQSNILEGITHELFDSKILIKPVALFSLEGSHWVFLIIDGNKGTISLLDTENSHATAIESLLANSSLRNWKFAIIKVDHQEYSDGCGVEGISKIIAYLQTTPAIDPASAAVVQSITYLDYLTGALSSILNPDQFHRIKDYLMEQWNKAINFALDTNNTALVTDLIAQGESIPGMKPLVLRGAPFKPGHDNPNDGGHFGGDNHDSNDVSNHGFAPLTGCNATNHTDTEGGFS